MIPRDEPYEGPAAAALARDGAAHTAGGSRDDHYLLSQSIDGGAYSSVSSSLAATTLTRNLVPGHTYRFAIRAVDKAGNVCALYYGFTFRLTGLHESNAAIHYNGIWPTSTESASPAVSGCAASRASSAR